MVRTGKQVTIQQIADHCGLSKSTVAYVLRKGEQSVSSEKTRKLVMETARKLGYRGNPAARALSTRCYHAIGLLFPQAEGSYAELMIHLDRTLKKKGYHGIYSFWHNGGFQEALDKLCQQGIDGIISLDNDPYPDPGKPTVIYGNPKTEFDCVWPDKVDCILRAADYLIRRGYTRIGFAGLTREIRAMALRRELAARGLEVREEWFLHTRAAVLDNGPDIGRKLLELEERPEALILHSDTLVPGLLHEIRGRISVPGELALIGFDNVKESRYFDPPLTTFDQCLEAAAEQLVELLFLRMEQPDAPLVSRSFTMPLIERDSTPERIGRKTNQRIYRTEKSK